jgi:hypothetical protein
MTLSSLAETVQRSTAVEAIVDHCKVVNARSDTGFQAIAFVARDPTRFLD